MVNIQSPTAEIRRGKKKKKQDENIMVCPITQGDHNNNAEVLKSNSLILFILISSRRMSII